MDVSASVPSFGAGSGLWATALALISLPRVFPFIIRILGFVTASMFAATGLQIFTGVQLSPHFIPVAVFRLSLLCGHILRLDMDALEAEWLADLAKPDDTKA
jgi:hypothetical protein